MKKVLACSLALSSSLAVFAIGREMQTPHSSDGTFIVVLFFLALLAALIVPLPFLKSSKKDQKAS